MSQQTYPVVCGCGTVHDVTGGQAGSSFPCGCGQTVEVPVHSQLRTAVGQAAFSPEVEIQVLMSRKALPAETDCCLCKCPTTEQLVLVATCEMPQAPSAGELALRSGCLFAPFGIFGLIGSIVRMTHLMKTDPKGLDLRVRLALRMCQPCAFEVSSWEVIRRAMRRTPVYARLLDKYPECRLSTVKSL